MSKIRNYHLLNMCKNANLSDKEYKRQPAAFLLGCEEDELNNMDINDIAEKAECSKATVVRFCKSLGFVGLKDFKLGYEKTRTPEYGIVTPVSTENETEAAEMFADAIKGAANRTFYKTQSLEKILALADYIIDADDIVITAEENELHVAVRLASNISAVYPEKKVSVNSDKPGDLCIVLSLSGNSKDAMMALTDTTIAGGKVFTVSGKADALTVKAATDSLIISDDVVLPGTPHTIGFLMLSAIVDYIHMYLIRERKEI